MATIENENKRAIAQGAKVSKDGFKGMTPRNGVNTLQDGDVFTIPESYTVLEQIIRGAAPRTNPTTGKPEKPTYKYIYVDVQRGDKKCVAQFTPTAFWKSRQKAEMVQEDDTEKWVGSGEYVSASGDAAEAFCDYPDADEALKALAGRKIKVTFETYKVMNFDGDAAEDTKIGEYTFEA